ncbi:MAG: response regulator transcription factor [Nitrospirae bacterium]|nr:response regulator transcription factor [Nitrospirota bacterium]MBI5696393.1 response regulator transcription factor [Nitrospirota bacterium]
MKKILYIDDDPAFLKAFEDYVHERYPGIETLTCQDPVKALTMIDPSLDLLLIDLEMPRLDGKKLLSFAIERGLARKKIIILSGRDADYLHDQIPMGECLCVLNKHEMRQKQVLEMVLASIHKK